MVDSVLHDILKDELAGLERVVALLHAEHEVLTRARIDDLAGISEQKEQAVQSLEKLSAVRRNMLTASNIPDDGSAIAEWLLVHDPRSLALWETLIDLARQASQFNRNNGQLLACREEANRALMNVLLSGREIENGYTADGRLSHAAARRPLDRA